MKRIIVFLAALVLAAVLAVSTKVHAVSMHLRVAFNCHQAPYHYVDEEGNATGLHIDLLNAIAKNAGFTLEYFPMETGTDCMNAMQNGNVDIVLELTYKFEDSTWVTTPLTEETVCSVQSIDEEKREAPVIASFQLGTVTPTISSKFRASHSLPVSNQEKVVDQLIQGKASMIVGLKESILFHLQNQGLQNKYTIINNYLGIASFSLMVPENDYVLLNTLNREILSLRTSDQYGAIRDRWSYQEKSYRMPQWLKTAFFALTIALVAIFAYAILISNLKRVLQATVEKQTIELQKANKEIQQHLEDLKVESDMRNRIIRYSYLGMLLINSSYEIQLANASALALAGVSAAPKDVRELDVFSQIVKASDIGRYFDGSLAAPDGTQTILLEHSGQERQYRYSVQKLLKSGRVWAILIVVEDITNEELRRQAAFEEEKSRNLNRVVAGIAHEIKNPLMAIKTFVEAVKSVGSDPKFLEDFNNYVPAEVDRINRLVEGLINYARPAHGVVELVDLTALVWDTTFFAKSTNRLKNIVIESELEDDHYALVNRDQIKQVLINIIMNGIESMQEKLAGGDQNRELTMRIQLFREGANSVVIIRDEGMGMTKEAIERCVDPFFTTKKAGTGLGLSLSQRYIRENNSQMTITSQPGAYTQVKITFRSENLEAQNTNH